MPLRETEASRHSSRHDLTTRGSLPSLVLPRGPEDEQASCGLERIPRSEARERRNSVPDGFKPPRVPDLWETSQIEWERGRPDYLGVNAFEEIRRRLDDTLGERMRYDYHDPSSSSSQNTVVDGRRGSEDGECGNADVDDHSVQEHPPPPDDRHSWEVGRPDYMGKASFDFILKRMAATIGREEIAAIKKRKGMEEGEDKENKKKSSSEDSASTPPSLIVPKRRVVFGSRGSDVDRAQRRPRD